MVLWTCIELSLLNFFDSLYMHISRTYIIFGFIILALLAIAAGAKSIFFDLPVQKNENASVAIVEPVVEVAPVPIEEHIDLPFSFNTSTILSKEETEQVKTYFSELIQTESPKVALSQMRILTNEYPSISRICHDLVHEIGHQTYEKYGDFASSMAYRENMCGSGFLHGVIETHFAKVDNVFTEMDTICDTYTTTNDKAKCYHGVGHGIMYYSQNDLPISIERCDRYQDSEAKLRCAEGVFMENFNTDNDDHVSLYLDEQNPASVCVDLPPIYKGTCYFYAPLHYLSLHVDAYEEALVWCTTQETDFQPVCASGVGSRAIKQHITSPQYVEHMCMSGTPDQERACLDGMVSYYLVHVDSLSKARDMCFTLKASNQQACESSVFKRKDFFPEQ